MYISLKLLRLGSVAPVCVPSDGDGDFMATEYGGGAVTVAKLTLGDATERSSVSFLAYGGGGLLVYNPSDGAVGGTTGRLTSSSAVSKAGFSTPLDLLPSLLLLLLLLLFLDWKLCLVS